MKKVNISHMPNGYICPFCEIAGGHDILDDGTKQSDVFYSDDTIMAFISNRRWKNNPGNIIIIPLKHYENLYEIPDDILSDIHIFSKKISIAMKEIYKCEGTSIRQHNEPAGNQDVWHYHLHVFPRHQDDGLYELHQSKYPTPVDERKHFACLLRKHLSN